MSRVVIREAVRYLQARGIVDVKHGSGTYIKNRPSDTLSESLILLLKLEETSLIDLYVVRQALELVAAPRAAQYATEAHITKLRNCLDEMSDLITKGIQGEEQFQAFTNCDIKHHLLIADASANLPLATLLSAILPLIMKGRLEIINRTGGIQRFFLRSSLVLALQEHTNIVHAISNRDTKAAELFMSQHLQRALATYRDLES